MSIEVDNNAGRIIGLSVFHHDSRQNHVLTYSRSSQASATARLKSKMEQAVFFGDRSDVCTLHSMPADITRTHSRSIYPPDSKAMQLKLLKLFQPKS